MSSVFCRPPANNSADMYLGASKAACEAKHMAAYGNAGKDGAASEVSEATFFNKYWYPWILYVGCTVCALHYMLAVQMLAVLYACCCILASPDACCAASCMLAAVLLCCGCYSVHIHTVQQYITPSSVANSFGEQGRSEYMQT